MEQFLLNGRPLPGAARSIHLERKGARYSEPIRGHVLAGFEVSVHSDFGSSGLLICTTIMSGERENVEDVDV